ncbi:MAG: hypothetical protein Q9167_005008 [Letrouitia subvulpina]
MTESSWHICNFVRTFRDQAIISATFWTTLRKTPKGPPYHVFLSSVRPPQASLPNVKSEQVSAAVVTMTGHPDDLSEIYNENLSASSSSLRSTTLANKVTSILSASYADPELRDALWMVDQRKMHNTPEVRRKLRLEIQKEVIECNSGIIRDFGNVKEQLERIGSTISTLNKCCENMRHQVNAARQENAPVLEEAKALLAQREDLKNRKSLLDAFNEHFVISDEEIAALTTATGVPDERFFSVLARVKRVHSDCQVLLGDENQRLGLELMEQVSKYLNVGYQKLYRWLQQEFKNFNLDNPQIGFLIRRALRTLAERPALFHSCLDIFAEARERVLSEGFYSSLTGSSNKLDQDSTAKPIEFYAHDSLRYVGDMLAWTHSAAVSEREALEGLFITEGEDIARGIQAGRQMDLWSALDSDNFDGKRALSDLANRNFLGVARVLRQRVEQAIQNQEDAILLYKIANLVGFYQATFEKLLGRGSSIMETLSTLENSALQHFQTIMTDFVASIQADVIQPPRDLKVPNFLEETLSQLKELIKSYESSMSPTLSQNEGFQPVLNQTLVPVLESCETLAMKLDEPARSIFLSNCYLASKLTLQPYHLSQAQTTRLAASLESSISNLQEYQHAFFLHTSGLHSLLEALVSFPDTTEPSLAIRNHPRFQSASLTEASQTLDDFLPSALMDATDNLRLLSDAKLAREITAEGADRFCKDFEFVEGKLVEVDELTDRKMAQNEEDGTNGEEQIDGHDDTFVPLRSLFPRTSGEIRVLLS